MRTRTTFVSAAIVLLTALAFACQISLASAAEEAKKHKKSKGSKISRSTSAKAQPGEGIQKKSKGTQVSRYTPTIAQPGGGIRSEERRVGKESRAERSR